MIDELICRLDVAKDIVNGVYHAIKSTDIEDSDIDHLANLTCEIDEAMAELENLK